MSGVPDGEGLLADAVTELYAAAPEQFVALRTRWVARAREAGRRDLATQLGALRRPTISAWALNRLVRCRPDVLAELRGLGARLRAAQAAVDATALGSLRVDRDRALDALVAAAREVAEQDGHALTDATAEEVRSTGIAALADADAEEAAWSGSLSRPLAYAGFGEVDLADAVARTATGVVLARLDGGGTQVSEEPAAEAGPDARTAATEPEHRADRREEDEEADRAVAALHERLADLDRSLRRAARRAGRAQQALQDARSDLDRARELLGEREAALHEAEAAVLAARGQLQAVRREVAAGVDDVDDAEQEAAERQAEVDRLQRERARTLAELGETGP